MQKNSNNLAKKTDLLIAVNFSVEQSRVLPS